MTRKIYEREVLCKLVQDVLCTCTNKQLTFDEIYNAVSSKLHEQGLEVPPKYYVRMALAELVRKGVIARLPSYDSSKMVFVCTSS
ncbi:MAG TPA: hypothetical protein EYP08_04560 [Pyrodictiaceae archaeon]|nr:hypothetical protein [Pyrodictiaceae archaeon]HIQ55517.1 hypothetical protein [Pyrodictium sp.]